MGNKQTVDRLNAEVSAYEIPLKHAPKTVLDIGANIGFFSLRASQLWPEAHITAYEPMPQLQESLVKNSRGRFYVNDSAIRSFTGVGEMLEGDCMTTSSFYDLGRQSKTPCTVNCLDAAGLDSAEFVKIDTEGCEWEILQRLDLSNTKAIALEYHSNEARKSVSEFMAEKGFVSYRNYSCGQREGVARYIREGVELKTPQPKLFIGLPAYFHIDPHFFKCAMKLMAEFSVNCRVVPLVGDSLIPRARNALSRMFLESDCTHILMIDSDLVFSNDHVKRIFSHNEDVVGGFYPKKKEGTVDMVCNALNPQPPMNDRRLTPLKYIGSGFICISRHVFEKMIEVYGEEIGYTWDEDGKTTEYDFWSCGVYTFKDGFKRYLSEDWYFCQRALDLGFTVYGDNGVTLKHSGNAIYPLQHQMEQQKIFSPNTADSAVVVTEAVSPRLSPSALTI